VQMQLPGLDVVSDMQAMRAAFDSVPVARRSLSFEQAMQLPAMVACLRQVAQCMRRAGR